MCNHLASLWSLRSTGAALAACFLALGSGAEDAADAERSSKKSS